MLPKGTWRWLAMVRLAVQIIVPIVIAYWVITH